jgi:hypothetical protein
MLENEVPGNSSLNVTLEQNGLSKEEMEKYYFDEDYETYRVEYRGDFAQKVNQTGIAQIFLFDKFFAVLFVKVGMLNTILRQFPEIISLEKSLPFTLLNLETSLKETDVGTIDLKGIDLDGTGVIVGILSTGIDYLDESFMNENGMTRIISIWDQSLRHGPSPETFVFGTEFSREDIDRAIIGNILGKNPYEIVSHRDDTGFGTKVAKIIGGRRKDPLGKIVNIAPKCEFIVVKIKKGNKSNLRLWGLEDYPGDVYDSNTVSAGFRYLYLMGKKLNKPVVIYNPFVTNVGGHDGGTLLERYLDFFTNERGYSIVTSTGNQGGSPIHFSGNLIETQNEMKIPINVDEDQKNLFFSLYFYSGDSISFGITSPTGESLNEISINPIEGEVLDLKLGESLINLQYLIEGAQYPSQRIDFVIRNVVGGTWTVNINKVFILNGNIDLWLQQKEFSKGNTGLLESTEDVTLMTPSAARNLIVASSYNQIEGKILEESGRGFTRDGRIVPTVAVSAKNIITNGFRVSGSAISASILTGIVALIYQWGVVNGNDVNMYSTKIKSYLITSATKDGENYPNKETGWGVLNIRKLFEELNVIPNMNDRKNKQDSFELLEQFGNIYINIPKELYTRLQKPL